MQLNLWCFLCVQLSSSTNPDEKPNKATDLRLIYIGIDGPLGLVLSFHFPSRARNCIHPSLPAVRQFLQDIQCSRPLVSQAVLDFLADSSIPCMNHGSGIPDVYPSYHFNISILHFPSMNNILSCTFSPSSPVLSRPALPARQLNTLVAGRVSECRPIFVLISNFTRFRGSAPHSTSNPCDEQKQWNEINPQSLLFPFIIVLQFLRARLFHRSVVCEPPSTHETRVTYKNIWARQAMPSALQKIPISVHEELGSRARPIQTR